MIHIFKNIKRRRAVKARLAILFNGLTDKEFIDRALNQ